MIFCVLIDKIFEPHSTTSRCSHLFLLYPHHLLKARPYSGQLTLVPCLPSQVLQPGSCPHFLTRKSLSHPLGFSCGSLKSFSLMSLTRTSLGLHVHPQAAAAWRISSPPSAPRADSLCSCPQRPSPPCGVVIHMCCMASTAQFFLLSGVR